MYKWSFLSFSLIFKNVENVLTVSLHVDKLDSDDLWTYSLMSRYRCSRPINYYHKQSRTMHNKKLRYRLKYFKKTSRFHRKMLYPDVTLGNFYNMPTSNQEQMFTNPFLLLAVTQNVVIRKPTVNSVSPTFLRKKNKLPVKNNT